MENIITLFKDVYVPKKALVIYQSEETSANVYVEAYDMNRDGKPINAHPLSVQEATSLADCFATSTELNNSFIQSNGLLPNNVLYLNCSIQGYAIWHTPMQEAELLFTKSLGIPSGKAIVPPLIWKADKTTLHLYAIKSKSKPDAKTLLFNAPFFNMYEDDSVCMGTVDVNMEGVNSLEAFIHTWEGYYWNSYFSHLIQDRSPIQGNIVQLWQDQVRTKQKFPLDVLLKNGKIIQDLIR